MKEIFSIFVLFYLHDCTRSWAENLISLNDPMPCKSNDLGMDCNEACKKISANLYGCCRTEIKLREPCYGGKREACCCQDDNSEGPPPERYCQPLPKSCEGCCCAPPKNMYRFYCGCEEGDPYQPDPYQPDPYEPAPKEDGGGSPCCGGGSKSPNTYCCGPSRKGYFEQKFKSCYCCERNNEDEGTSSNTNLGTCTILPHQVFSANLELSEDTFCNSKQNCQPLFIKNVEFSFGKQITACNS